MFCKIILFIYLIAGLCFIDWATKCSLGPDVDLYGLQGCHNWANQKYCELKNEIQKLEILVRVFSFFVKQT